MYYKKTCTNQDFLELVKYIEARNKDVIISGGCARRLWYNENWHEGDVDIFFKNEKAFHVMVDTLKTLTRSTQDDMFVDSTSFETKNAITYNVFHKARKVKVQLIHNRWYKNIPDLWRNFDFTICQFAFYNNKLIANRDAVRHVNSQSIHMIKNTTRECFPRRLIKYGFYGFVPSKKIRKKLIKEWNKHGSLEHGGNHDDMY